MKLLPELSDLPELESLPPEQRKRLVRDFSRRAHRRLATWLVIVGLLVGYFAVVVAFRHLFPELASSLYELAVLLLLSFVLLDCYEAAIVHVVRRELRRELGRCPDCGYDLRATPDPNGPRLPRCPECGREVDAAG